MEHSQHIKALYQKYLDNMYSEQELDELLEYFYRSAEHHDLSDMIKAELEKNENNFQSQAAVKSLLAELDQELFVEIEKRRKSGKRIKLWPRIAVAAAAVTAIVFGVWVYTSPHLERSEATRDLSVKSDIAPGHNGATLTLANGKVIELSNAKMGVVIGDDLKYNDGSSVLSSRAKAKDLDSSYPRNDKVVELIASTAKGQTYHIVLPDGTRVWLNADSKISFPSKFIAKERKILLDGEGYFEVAKNKIKPFIVESNGQHVEVLGTHFNINSYSDEGSVKTTLLEGTVRVSSVLLSRANTKDIDFSYSPNDKGRETSVILKPNQQSVVTGSNRIDVKEIDVNEVLAWKNGDFVFKADDFKTIMRKVARWYNVEIIYDETAPANLPLGGVVSRSKNISAVLKIIEATGDVHFKIEGRKVTVSR